MPNYMADIVPPTIGQKKLVNLRNAQDFCGIYAQTEKFKGSFYPKSIREYNQLPV